MKKRLLSVILLVGALFAVMWLLSWAMSGDRREKQNRKFQERVLIEQKKMQQNVER